jgi:PilZ domain-containing protein
MNDFNILPEWRRGTWIWVPHGSGNEGTRRNRRKSILRNGTLVQGLSPSKPVQPARSPPEWTFKGVHTLGLMLTAAGTAPAPLPAHRKSVARVALFDLPEPSSTLISDCFRQFGIETVPISSEDAERLRREKFEACVLPLGPSAGNVIALARSSSSNGRIVIYGLGGSAQDSLQYSKLCINAVFQEPLERSAALKLVRATRMLVLHEFRRYVRVPVMTEVSIVVTDGMRLTATTLEISSGGMSLKANYAPEPGTLVELSFALLTLPRVWVRGYVTWKKANKSFGIRFDATDERRRRLKEWIVTYLET